MRMRLHLTPGGDCKIVRGIDDIDSEHTVDVEKEEMVDVTACCPWQVLSWVLHFAGGNG